jgi:hypothetical protein
LFVKVASDSERRADAAIPHKTEFVDNREVRLVDALRCHLDGLRENYAKMAQRTRASENDRIERTRSRDYAEGIQNPT